MMYRITLYNRETDTRISKKFTDPTADELSMFLVSVESFDAGDLTDWDIIDIHEISEEVAPA